MEMKAKPGISVAKWLVAVVLAATAQFVIAPRPADARCGDYVMLGRHPAHLAPVAGEQAHSAPLHIDTAPVFPDPTHAVAGPFRNGPDRNREIPAQKGRCTGPMCSGESPRPFDGPPIPVEPQAQQWGLISASGLETTGVPQFARLTDGANIPSIIAGGLFRPPGS